MNAKAIVERMKLALSVQTDQELSLRIRVPSATILTWKKRDRVPFDVLDSFSDDFDVSLDWLVKGTNAQNTELSVDQMEARAFPIAIRMALLIDGMEASETIKTVHSARNLVRIIVAQVAVQMHEKNISLSEAFELQEKTLENLEQARAAKAK